MAAKGKGPSGGRLPPVDYSVLQTPINLGIVGALQVSRCLASGTAEVRDLLLEECDLIYECKVCRSLFRTLPNFMAHKRVYCKDCFEDTKLNFVERRPVQETVVVHPKPPAEVVREETDMESFAEASKPSKSVPDTSSSSVDIKKKPTVWQQMLEGTFVGKSPSFDFYTKAVERSLKTQQSLKTCVVKLEPVRGNPNAMFQKVVENASQSDIDSAICHAKATDHLTRTTEKESDGENILLKTGVCEPSDEYPRTSLRQREGGKVVPGTQKAPTMVGQLDKKMNMCPICKTRYSSMHRLQIHIHSAHKDRHIVFPCLLCKSIMKDFNCLRGHLRTAHNQSKQWLAQNVDHLKRRATPMLYTQLPAHLKKVFREMNSEDDLKEQYNVSSNAKKTNSKSKRNALSARCTRASRQKPSSDNSGLGPLACSSDFLLFKCMTCEKVFGKRESLERHQSFCLGLEGVVSLDSSSSSSHSVYSYQTPFSGDVSKVEIDERASDTTGSEPKHRDLIEKPLTTHRWSTSLSDEEVKKITKLIDENKIICLKCNRRYGNLSNLHRHAVRHLGWRRFQCTLCEFTGYNRSECKTHLQRVHCQKSNSDLNKLILDLEPDKIKGRVSSLSRVESKRMSSLRIFERMQQEHKQQQQNGDRSMPGVDVANIHTLERNGRKFNISTRSSPRKFDTTPYKPVDHMTVLLTRSGYYEKPIVDNPTDSSSDENDAAVPEKEELSNTTGSFNDVLPPAATPEMLVDDKDQIETTLCVTEDQEVVAIETNIVKVSEEVVPEMTAEETESSPPCQDEQCEAL